MIKNSATEAKIRKLAKATGRSLTAAIDHAVERELAQVAPPRRRKGRIDRKTLAKLLEYFDTLPVDDPRPHDEIVGYDEIGVPR
ncbi:MAG: type II toxin-antitoxin system VapB family antitoxin [Hyphomicrobiales bacterium]|nr:type II toxin-antitoxin system VapB family antitoxin [Hyphomicrobiales bacterium]